MAYAHADTCSHRGAFVRTDYNANNVAHVVAFAATHKPPNGASDDSADEFSDASTYADANLSGAYVAYICAFGRAYVFPNAGAYWFTNAATNARTDAATNSAGYAYANDSTFAWTNKSDHEFAHRFTHWRPHTSPNGWAYASGGHCITNCSTDVGSDGTRNRSA
jgi:hypothetical protein